MLDWADLVTTLMAGQECPLQLAGLSCQHAGTEQAQADDAAGTLLKGGCHTDMPGQDKGRRTAGTPVPGALLKT